MASSTAKMLRRVFVGPAHGADPGMINRLNQSVLKALRAGEEGKPGLRDLHQADLSLLEGFQFNKQSPLEEVLAVKPDVLLNESGSIHINLPVISQQDLCFPQYSHHCTLRLLVAALDFKKETYQYLGHQDIKIKNGRSAEALLWEVEEKAENGNIILVSLSLHYFSSDGVNDEGISLNSKEFSPAGIIAAMHVVSNGTEEAPTTGALLHKYPRAGYNGNELLRDFQRLQAKKKKKTGVVKDEGLGSGGLPLVPKGKVSFKQ
jgi:hypothetical protein